MRFATQQAQGGRKRTRVQAELETASHSCHPTEDRRKRKQLYRKQIEASRPDAADFDEETYVPVIEVEDISNEVEARLELKEITRRNIMGNRERKRKRDNPGSAMQASSGLQESASSRKRARF